MGVTWNEAAPDLIDALLRLFPSGLTWRRTFPGDLEQVGRARRFVGFLLADTPCRQDAEQITAELAANAVFHSASGRSDGTFTVEVVRKAATVRITVYDQGGGGTPRFARREEAEPYGERGRGLALVTALASAAGHRGDRESGHAVWARLPTGRPRTDGKA